MKQLLDPISTMCKLISLNFMEASTKLSIQNHVLTIHQPTGFQFAIRFCNGDSKENISELYYVIIRIIKWYLFKTTDNTNDISNNYTDISKSDELVRMIKYMCCSFNKLQETYKIGNVILALQFYINLLSDGLANKFDESKLPAVFNADNTEVNNLLDYEKLKNFWSLERLKQVSALYDNCFTIYYSTDMQDTIKNGLVNSYLKSIFAILDMIDIEFQSMIENCNNG